MQIDILDEGNLMTQKQARVIKELIQKTLQFEEINILSEVSVSIIRDNEIKKLNQEFRDINAPTDVLSFPMIEDFNQSFLPDITYSLGDIVISYERAVAQAKEYNHSLERELGFLTVHSVLHLLGYTHETKEEEEEMNQIQTRILEDYGLER